MRFVVTGGAGFIGSHTVAELVRRGHSVVVFDDLSTGSRENLMEVNDKIILVRASITNLKELRKAMRDADCVLHLAAVVSVPRSVKDPIETNQINIDGTLNVMVAARDARVKRLVFAGSSAAYGDAQGLPKSERMQPDPVSPYGVSKYVGELYAQAFFRCYGLETVALRYFNIFGPRQDASSAYSGVLAKFCKAFLDGEQPVILGDGEQTRDFTYVANAVQANLLACEAPKAVGRVFNIGTGVGFSLNQAVELLNKITAKCLGVEYARSREGDIRHSLADISLARQLLGYEPSIAFGEGLRRTFDWYRSKPTQARFQTSTAR